MDDNFTYYFNRNVDQIERLGEESLRLEKRTMASDEQIERYKNFFNEEFAAIKNLIHDVNLFVNGLTEQFEKLQEDSNSFVGKEELDELKESVALLNFENLMMRKSFKEKIFKSN